MGRPRPAAPLPIRQNEFQGAVDDRAGGRGPVNEGEYLAGGLRRDRGGQGCVAGRGVRLAAASLAEAARCGTRSRTSAEASSWSCRPTSTARSGSFPPELKAIRGVPRGTV